jgi:hypothetical protein
MSLLPEIKPLDFVIDSPLDFADPVGQALIPPPQERCPRCRSFLALRRYKNVAVKHHRCLVAVRRVLAVRGPQADLPPDARILRAGAADVGERLLPRPAARVSYFRQRIQMPADAREKRQTSAPVPDGGNPSRTMP